MKPQKEPTHTTLVMEALQGADDFLTQCQLIAAGCGNSQQVSAACLHLLHRHAIGVEIQHGTNYWYATPKTDNRLYAIKVKAVEPKGNRRRKSKAKGGLFQFPRD